MTAGFEHPAEQVRQAHSEASWNPGGGVLILKYSIFQHQLTAGFEHHAKHLNNKLT